MTAPALLLGVGLMLLPWAAQADPCKGPLPTPGQSFAGQVRYVGDGDSLCISASADPATWMAVRIADFYAPELQGPGGQQAKATLERVVSGRAVPSRAALPRPRRRAM